MNRRLRPVVVAVAALAALTLIGCDSKFGAAAYVGDQRLTEHDLDEAVDRGLAVPDIRTVIDGELNGDLAAYRRIILNYEVGRVLLTEAAERLDVSVSEATVDEQVSEFTEQTGGDSRAAFHQIGLTQEAGRAVLRDSALFTEIGYATSEVPRTDAQLRDSYEQNPEQYAAVTLGLVQVPDRATADAVAEELRQNVAGFAGVAARFPTGLTTPEPRQFGLSAIPPELRAELDTLEPGAVTVFEMPQVGTLVIHYAERGTVAFESVVDQLRQQSEQAATQAAQGYLMELARELTVRINPRYGAWDYDANQVADLSDSAVRLAPSETPGEAPSEAPASEGTVPEGAAPEQPPAPQD